MADVDQGYICPVCQEVFKKPTSIAGCSHMFCGECVRRLVQSCPPGSAQCPVCRATFSPNYDLRPCRDMERAIATGTAKCRNCHTQVSLLKFDAHILNCSKTHAPHTLPTHQGASPINRSTFKCPLCEQTNLDCQGLLDHVNAYHSNSTQPVVCPVCASMPWGSSHQLSQNFVKHLNLRHQFEYNTFVDYELDDDKALKDAIQASLRDN